SYRHKNTAEERAQHQVEPQGGIIADEMGLGKTLTAISLIVSSLARSDHFANQSSASASRSRSRATLVAVPSTQLMESWSKQLQQYVDCGSGASCRSFQLVLYGTFIAHIIRTRRTTLFAAIVALEALYYWCLTGTPISNKIDDLYALLHFWRVPLLGDDLTFRQNVIVPSRKSSQRGCNILRDTLRPICLRQKKGIIGLANPDVIEKQVDFSEAESKHYRGVLERGRRAIDGAVRG
ncbi:hypothetical protein CERZMDRAFT_7145, partial [Cercospora zeae-maydis SCOH1-5]